MYGTGLLQELDQCGEGGEAGAEGQEQGAVPSARPASSKIFFRTNMTVGEDMLP